MRAENFTFRGMQGVAGELSGPAVTSVTAMVDALKLARVASAAGDCGSVTAWRDDDGVYRCELNRFQRSLAHFSATSRTGLYGAIRLMWPCMRDEAAPTPRFGGDA